MRSTIVSTVAFFVMIGQLYGQDIHFSQYYRSPLTLSPALTGLSLGSHRGVVNYRNQWSSVMKPFQTFSVSYDAVLMNEQFRPDVVGVGGYIMKDQVGEVGLSRTNVMLSGAYHKALSPQHYIAAGFQLGGGQRKVDYEAMTFSSQWSRENGLERNVSSGEEGFDQTSYLYFDMNMGALWYYYLRNGANIFAGASLFHLTKPKETFLGTDNHLNRRLVLNAGSRLPITKQLNIVPNFLFMKQSSAQEIDIGVSAEYNINDLNRVTFGTLYRSGDAFIVSGSFEYSTYSLGLSYDFNVSELRTASGGWGGFELSLIIVYPPDKVLDMDNHPCPRI